MQQLLLLLQHLHELLPLGLSQLCSNICPICSWEFPEIFTYYALHFSHYACVMLKDYSILIFLVNECSIKIFQLILTVLLENINQTYLRVLYTDCSIREYQSI